MPITATDSRRPAPAGRRSRRHARALFAWPLALLLAAAPARAQEPAPAEAADLLARERAIADAMHRRDAAALEPLLGDGFVMRGAPDIDRQTWIRNAVSLCWGDRSDIEGFDVQRLDDVAVTSFVLTFYTDPDTCRPALLRSLITGVWIRQDGTWRLRLRHAGPVPATGGVLGQFGAVPEPPPDVIVNLEMSAVGTGGNTSTRSLGVAGDVAHRGAASTSEAASTFLTSTTEGVTGARAFTARARHGRRLRDGLEAFGRAAYLRDRFAGIANRSQIDGGIAVTASPAAPLVVTAELGAGVTVEDRLDVEDLQFATGNGTLALAWTPRAGTEVKDSASLVLDLEDGRNWRTSNLLSAAVVLTRLLSVKATQAFEYRHAPVPGFRRIDLRSSVALVLRFERRP